MEKELSQLTAAEQKQLIDAPALIAALIASADGKVSEAELDWAEQVVEYRRSIGDETLFEYYVQVEKDFEDTMEDWAENKMGTQERLAALTTELEKLNEVLPKLSKSYREALTTSWRSLAKQVAKSAGGFLGFGSVSQQEEALMDLPMIKH